MPIGRQTAKKLSQANRIELCLGFRLQGLPYRAISEQMLAKHGIKVSRSQVAKDIEKALALTKERTKGEAEHLVQMQLEHLNIAQSATMPGVARGDHNSINTFLKILERRAKLLGLDNPVQLKIEQGIESDLEKTLLELQSIVSPDTFQEFLSAAQTLEDRRAASATN